MSSPESEQQGPLEPYRIHGLPQSFFYIPNFLSKEEEKILLEKAL